MKVKSQHFYPFLGIHTMNLGDAGNLRIKTAMVLFELEQALASYVTDVARDTEYLPSGMCNDIIKRSQDRGNDTEEPHTLSAIISETYLSELIDLAIAASSLRSDGQHLQNLKQLAQDLTVFDIRNAVCHPNRPFPECYWYRIAAIATDPCISALNLTRVRNAFSAAHNGDLSSPPEDWLTQAQSVVPNNLPSALDHAITGLIGRDKEVAKLEPVSKPLQNRK